MFNFCFYYQPVQKDAEKARGASSGTKNDRSASSKPLKEKTTKAERRALQEAQRAAKAASKGVYGSLLIYCNSKSQCSIMRRLGLMCNHLIG